MRILHVQGTLSPRNGGPSEVLPALCRVLESSGHSVEILTTNIDMKGIYHNPGWDVLPDSDVRVQFCPVQFRPLEFSVEVFRYLRTAISEFDLLHIHGLYRFPTTFAAYEARRQRIPYIIRTAGSLDPYLYERSSKSVGLKRLYERLFDLPNLNAAGAIHYTAEDERKKSSFLGLHAPSFIVPNGLDWQRYAHLPQRGKLRERLGLGDAPMVLFLGRIHFKKGLDLLVEAFDAVHMKVPNAQLVIAGPENDEYGSQVRLWVKERKLTDRVHFVGPLKGDDVQQAYVDADVFALPSYTENFGMTVAEAMACALPVVVSDQVNIHAEVRSAGAGVITRCNAGEVAAALTNLLSNKLLRERMGAAGRRYVQDSWTWQSVVNSLVDEYEGVLRQHRFRAAVH